MLHFLETPFRLLMLEQKEDEGDLEPEAWSAGSLTDMRGHCTTPGWDWQLPSLQRKARLGNSSAFPSYLQCTPSLGEARLQHIRQCCIATLVMFGFGKKNPKHFQPTLHVPSACSSDDASCWTGMALPGGNQRGPDAAERAQEKTAAIHICGFPCMLQRDTFCLFEKDLMPSWK